MSWGSAGGDLPGGQGLERGWLLPASSGSALRKCECGFAVGPSERHRERLKRLRRHKQKGGEVTILSLFI